MPETRSEDELLRVLAEWNPTDEIPYSDVWAQNSGFMWVGRVLSLLAREIYKVKHGSDKLEPHVPYLDAN